MVCLGNICRSPLAEGIFQRLVDERGLTERYAVDSAGTSDEHEGEAPHRGSVAVARKYGIDITAQRSRPVALTDYGDFDWLIAMDTANRNALRHRAPPGFDHGRIKLLLDFAEFGPRDVPDPYYSGGFEEVFRLVQDGCTGLIDRLERDRASGGSTATSG